MRPIADCVISLSADGRVQNQVSPNKALESETTALASEFTQQIPDDKAERSEDAPASDVTERSKKGKLIVEEEASLGQVSWPACKCLPEVHSSCPHPSLVKLYLSSLGGQHPTIFWVTCLGAYAVCEVLCTWQVWFLGLWTRQYDLNPPEKVPVALCAIVSIADNVPLLTRCQYIAMFLYTA